MAVPNTIPVLHKSVRLLEKLAVAEPGSATLADLSRQLAIPSTTCYRMLKTFEHHEWLRQQPDNTYVFSCGMLPLLHGIDWWQEFLRKAKPELQKAADHCGLTAKLSIRKADQQISMMQAVPPLPMAVTSRIGLPFPVVEGAAGAALLCREDEQVVNRLHKQAERETRQLFPLDQLLDMCRACREKGFCHSTHPGRWGIYAVSAPLVDPSGHNNGALSLFGSQQMLEKAGVQKSADCLLELASRLAVNMSSASRPRPE